MGRAFDATGSYTSLLTMLSASTLLSAGLFLFLPKYTNPAGLPVKP